MMGESSTYSGSEYLSYQLLKQLSQHRDVSETEFNKLCYIADQALLEEDTDVGLPVYWYRYGPVVEIEGLDNEFTKIIENISESWGTSIKLDETLDEDNFRVEEDTRSRIYNVVADLVRRYKDIYDSSRAISAVYTRHSPNSFVETFHEFRECLASVEEHSSSINDFLEEDSQAYTGNQRELANKLDELVVEYPEDYSDFKPRFSQWESIARQMVKNEMYDDLDEFSDVFWKRFSRAVLRLHHNRNIPTKILSDWVDSQDEEAEKFENELGDYRRRVLDSRKKTEKLGTVEYSQTVRDFYRDVSETTTQD